MSRMIEQLINEISNVRSNAERTEVLFDFRGTTHTIDEPEERLLTVLDQPSKAALCIVEGYWFHLQFYLKGQEPPDMSREFRRWYTEKRDDDCMQHILHPSCSYGYCASIFASNDGRFYWCYVDYAQGRTCEIHIDPKKGLAFAKKIVEDKVDELHAKYGSYDYDRTNVPEEHFAIQPQHAESAS